MSKPHLFRHYQICARADGATYELRRSRGELVCLAFDQKADRFVEFHIVSPPEDADASFTERFMNLAEAAKSLAATASLPSVIDHGEDQGALFYVTTYCDGEDLTDYLNGISSFTMAGSIELARQLCEAFSGLKNHIEIASTCGFDDLQIVERDSMTYLRLNDLGLATATIEGGDDDTARRTAFRVVGRFLCRVIAGKNSEGRALLPDDALQAFPEALKTKLRVLLLSEPTEQVSNLEELAAVLRQLSEALESDSSVHVPPPLPALRIMSRLPSPEAVKEELLEEGSSDSAFDAVDGGFTYRFVDGRSWQPRTFHVLPPNSLVAADEFASLNRVVARINSNAHPNLVRVYGTRIVDQCLGFSEEIPEGIDFRTWVERRKHLPDAHMAGRILNQVDQAISQAESCGADVQSIALEHLWLHSADHSGETPLETIFLEKEPADWPIHLVKLRVCPTTPQMTGLYRTFTNSDGSSVSARALADLALTICGGTWNPWGITVAPDYSKDVRQLFSEYLTRSGKQSREQFLNDWGRVSGEVTPSAQPALTTEGKRVTGDRFAVFGDGSLAEPEPTPAVDQKIAPVEPVSKARPLAPLGKVVGALPRSNSDEENDDKFDKGQNSERTEASDEIAPEQEEVAKPEPAKSSRLTFGQAVAADELLEAKGSGEDIALDSDRLSASAPSRPTAFGSFGERSTGVTPQSAEDPNSGVSADLKKELLEAAEQRREEKAQELKEHTSRIRIKAGPVSDTTQKRPPKALPIDSPKPLPASPKPSSPATVPQAKSEVSPIKEAKKSSFGKLPKVSSELSPPAGKEVGVAASGLKPLGGDVESRESVPKIYPNASKGAFKPATVASDSAGTYFKNTETSEKASDAPPYQEPVAKRSFVPWLVLGLGLISALVIGLVLSGRGKDKSNGAGNNTNLVTQTDDQQPSQPNNPTSDPVVAPVPQTRNPVPLKAVPLKPSDTVIRSQANVAEVTPVVVDPVPVSPETASPNPLPSNSIIPDPVVGSSEPTVEPEVKVDEVPVADTSQSLVVDAQEALGNGDKVEGVRLLLKSLELQPENSQARTLLDREFAAMGGDSPIPSELLSDVGRAHSAGMTAASAALGRHHFDTDPKKAVRYLEEAALDDDADSMRRLGALLSSSFVEGISQDFASAALWFEKAANLGDERSYYLAGECYTLGKGVPRDAQRGVDYLEKAVAAGDARAMDLLGFCYSKGLGVSKDLAAARRLYDDSIKLGNLNSLANLGVLYMTGRGGPREPGTGVELFKTGAEKGNMNCMFFYAHCLENGDGVPKDESEAMVWYRKAARLGEPKAKEWCRAHDVAFTP